MRDMTLTLSIELRVNADDWGLAYGVDTEPEVLADVRQALPETAREFLQAALTAQANGAQVTGVRVDTIGIAPDVLAAELTAAHRGNTHDYPYVRAWGEFMGRSPAYINGEVEKARRTHAPATAIYHRDPTEGGPHGTNGWHTVEGIRNVRAIEALRVIVEREAARR